MSCCKKANAADPSIEKDELYEYSQQLALFIKHSSNLMKYNYYKYHRFSKTAYAEKTRHLGENERTSLKEHLEELQSLLNILISPLENDND